MQNTLKRMFALVVTFFTAMQCVLPTYAMEDVEPVEDIPQTEVTSHLNVEVQGEGSVSLFVDDTEHKITEEKSLTLETVPETSVKFEIKDQEDLVISEFKKDDEIVAEFEADSKTFEYTYTTTEADVNFIVSFEKESETDNSGVADENNKAEDTDVGTEQKNDSEIENESDGKEEFTEEIVEDLKQEAEKNEGIMTDVQDTTDVGSLEIDTERLVYVKYLYGDPAKIKDAGSIKEILLQQNNPIYTQVGEEATAYLDADGNYKVKADTPYLNGLASADPVLAEFARGNDFGEAITEGVSFDPVSKIATIQKDVFKETSDTDFAEVQLQLLIPANIESNLNVEYSVENQHPDVKLAQENGMIQIRPFMTARFQVVTEDTANLITSKNVEVYINGSDTKLDSDSYAYDNQSGQIGIKCLGAGLNKIHVVIKKGSKRQSRKGGIAEGNQSVGSYGVIAYLADGTDPNAFQIGASQEVRGRFGNNNWPLAPADSPTELYYASYNNVSAPNKDGTMTARGSSQFGIPTSVFGVDFTFRRADGTPYPLWEAGYNSAIASWCHHVQGLTLINSGNINEFKYPWCTIRVLDKQVIGGYVHVVFGFETNLWQYDRQTNGAVFEVAFKSTGSIKISKKSANADITANNSCYGSMSEAEYGLYSDAGATQKVGTFKFNEQGQSNEIKDLLAKTYYIKEIKAPKGYALDTTIYPVQIQSGSTFTKEFVDLPQSDPVAILLGKIDKETNMNKPQGSATLGGAEFTVKYYDVEFANDEEAVDPSTLGKEPLRTWVLKTDEDGCADLTEQYKVSGDDFYKMSNGFPTLPLGTITIQETKAPEGYKIYDEVFVRTVQSSGNTETVETYNQPEIPEEVMSGKFSIAKFITDANNSEIVSPEVDATFGAVLEKYYIEAGNDMEKAIELAKANGSEMEWELMKTDSRGECYSNELAYGTYIVKQMGVGTNGDETWELDETFKFIVSENGNEAYVYGETGDGKRIEASADGMVHYYINNIPFTSYVSITKVDQETGKTVTLNNASFKVQKFKKDGSLDTTYNKKTIRTDGNGYVSVKVGSRWYDTFVTNADNRLSIVDKAQNLVGGGIYEAGADENKGTVTVPLALPAGKYKLKEVKVPDGYLFGQDLSFELTKSNISGTDPDGQPVLSVKFADPKPKGRIELTKKFESDHFMHGSVTFDLIVTKDIVDPADGTVLYKAGDKYGTYELNKENNKIVIEDLPMGVGESHFKLVEASTYENYQLNTEEFNVDFVQTDDTTSTYTQKLTVENKEIKISTKALNAKTGEQEFNTAKEITVTDVVTYEGLTVGKEYTMKATLMDKDTGEAVKNHDGSLVEGETVFTAKTKDGEVEVTMTLDSSALGGEYVVFESLLNSGTEGHENCEIAQHKDLTDKNQTITVLGSKIHTTAKSENGTHEQQIKDGKMTLTDTVAYENLVVGLDYKLVGVLMSKETGKPLCDSNGKEITSEALFTTTERDGTIDVTFEFDATGIPAGTSTVVFETLYEVEKDKDIEVTKHEDIEDEGQTIHFIDIETKATSENGSNEQQVTDKKIKLIDTVTYTGLTVGKEYTMKGTLMDKSTGKELLVNGESVKAETTFVPEESDGTVEVVFEFDATGLPAGQDIVVFESLERNNVEIGVHTGIEDENQTIHIIEIKTTALSEKDNHTALAGKEIIITDTVAYENLEVGKEYTVKGKLMNKETGEALLVDGKEVVSETTFVPEENDGTVDVTFTLNSSALVGKEIVVFEDLYKDEIQVATHSDINDKNQTVKFKNFEVLVNKVDSVTMKNIVSNKFEFTMFKDEACKEAIHTVAGNTENGTAKFEVTEGTWFIKETKAPEGYELSKEVVKVEVKDDHLYVNDKLVETDENYVYSIMYQNVLLPSIVITGTNTNSGLFAGALVASLACMIGLAESKKRKK